MSFRKPVNVLAFPIFAFTMSVTTLQLFSATTALLSIKYNMRSVIKIKECLPGMRTFFRRIGT